MVTYSPFSYQTVGIQTQYISPIKVLDTRQSIKGRKNSTRATAKIKTSRPDAMKRMFPDAKVVANSMEIYYEPNG